MRFICLCLIPFFSEFIYFFKKLAGHMQEET